MAEFSFMLVADDYAMSPAVSRGIREALAAERLSGTGAMTNMPNWREAARALEADGLASKAGLHLNLTCGPSASRMPALAPTGTLPPFRTIWKGGIARSLPKKELASEIAAQLDLFCEVSARLPAFVDGHQHVQGAQPARRRRAGEGSGAPVERAHHGRVGPVARRAPPGGAAGNDSAGDHG